MLRTGFNKLVQASGDPALDLSPFCRGMFMVLRKVDSPCWKHPLTGSATETGCYTQVFLHTNPSMS